MSELNQEQKNAVLHKDGPALVIAGAGTGKTRVITERIAHIAKENYCANKEILALTFTDKSAFEMEERIDTLMPIGYENINIGTFHSFCEKTLRQYGIDIGINYGFKILEGVNQWKLIKDNLFNFDFDYYRPYGNPNKFINAILSHFSRLKEELISPEYYINFANKKSLEAKEIEDVLEAKKLTELAKAYKEYQLLLIKHNFLDFADLHYQVIELLKKRPNILKHLQNTYKYILVDEYQDTNIAQNKIVDLLAGKEKNIMVVGDDDQSIYKFRGAAISNILQFQEKYPNAKKIVLNQNYRSNQKILDFAYSSIQKNNPNRLEVKANINKKLIAQKEGLISNVKLIHSSHLSQEVDYIVSEIKKSKTELSDIAILVRANSHAEAFVEALKEENIPYQVLSEKGLYYKDEILDLISILRVLANPTDNISMYRVLRMPIWKIEMEKIAMLIATSKKKYNNLWSEIKKDPATDFLFSILKETIEYSKNHNTGESLYKFTELIGLYKVLLEQGDIEAEEKISNIANFFGKIKKFELNNEDKSIISFINYLELAKEAGENPSAKFDVDGIDGVQISTVHSSKGLEFNTVFLPNLSKNRFPTNNKTDLIKVNKELISEIEDNDKSQLEEERRLFYVASTRAKENLYLLWSDFYNTSKSKNPRKSKRSQFIDEIINEIEIEEIDNTENEKNIFTEDKSIIHTTNKNKEKKITSFSYSQISSFQRCPKKYEYEFIYKIPQMQNAALSFGSTMHNTLYEFYKIAEQSKQGSLFTEFNADLSLNRMLNIYEEKWINNGYDNKKHLEENKKRGINILKSIHQNFEKNIENIAFLEKGFKIKIGEYNIKGRIDRADKLEDESIEIIDYKTGKSKDQSKVNNDLQLMIYAIASEEFFHKKASKLTLYFLDEDIKMSTEANEKKIEKSKEKLFKTIKEINTFKFPAKPSIHTCSFCPYKHICKDAQ